MIGSQKLESGEENWDCLVLGWGSTYGAIQSAVKELRSEGKKVSHAHLRYINPLPRNLKKLLTGFKKVVIPELNSGQLSAIIRSEFLVDAKKITKIKGMPFQVEELKTKIKKFL